jgi:hypothetical protein
VKPGRGKQKGSEFERNICRELSLWISDGRYKNVFRRNTFTQTGDLIVNPALKDEKIRELALKFLDMFNVECKSYKNIDLLAELDVGEGRRKTTELESWWKQCCEDAVNSRKYSLLVIKRNRYKPYVVIDFEILLVLDKWFNILDRTENYFRFFLNKNEQVFLMKLKYFLDFDPETLNLIE